MKNDVEVKKVFDACAVCSDLEVRPDVDYAKKFEIMHERTGRQNCEEMSFKGEPIVENGNVVGGVVTGNVCYKGYGTSMALATDGINLSKEEWIKFVNKSVEISERKEQERKEQEIELHKKRVLEEYKRRHPVNMVLREYLSDDDKKTPVNAPNYEKEYSINDRTGGSWNECINARGKPVIEDGELVGGLVEMKISQNSVMGSTSKEYPYERVSAERWRAFVNRSVKLLKEKELTYTKVNDGIDR